MEPLLQNTHFLLSLLLVSLVGSFYTSKRGYDLGINILTKIEKTMGNWFFFGLIILLQAVLGGKGLTNTPKSIDKFFENPLVRYIALFLISFTATSNIENSLFIVLGFVAIMQLLRTPEERKKTPYLI